MRTVYASQFGLQSHKGDAPDKIVENVRDRVANWVISKYKRAWRADIKVPFDGESVSPIDGHSLRSRHHVLDDHELVSLEWVHPHDRDPSSTWHTSVTIARAGADVEMSVLLRIATAQMSMRPVGYDLGRPRIVTELIDEYDLRLNNWPVPASPEHLAASDVQRFVDQVLLDPARSLPVIVITPDVWTERPLVSPDETFDAVKGFAHVVVMDTKWAAFKLTDVVEKELSCYNGGVRIYWPGFSLDSNPFQHRLYLPGQLKHRRDKGVPFGRRLFRMLAAISAFRFVEGKAHRSVRKFMTDAERARVTELAAQVKRGKASQQELETKYLEALEKIDALEEERDQLKDDLDAQRAAWGEYQNFMATEAQSEAEEAVETKDEAAPAIYASVADAYEQAKKDFAGPLVFLGSADDSAAESPYMNSNRVYELFEALAQVAMEWRENKGNLGRSWEEALAELGFEYKDKVSQTSKTKWANEYTFTYKGKPLLFEQHITIGARQPDKCLSVHFYRDDDERVLVIGHCGRHLTNTSS